VVVPPVNVAVRVSVPPAPLSTSAEPKVAKLPPAPPSEPSKVSAPAPPVKGFALAVSGQVTCWRKVLIKKAFLLFLIHKLGVTHQQPISDLFSRGRLIPSRITR
jgi:hypothetical protein